MINTFGGGDLGMGDLYLEVIGLGRDDQRKNVGRTGKNAEKI
jgi:hypothetical protein